MANWNIVNTVFTLMGTAFIGYLVNQFFQRIDKLSLRNEELEKRVTKLELEKEFKEKYKV